MALVTLSWQGVGNFGGVDVTGAVASSCSNGNPLHHADRAKCEANGGTFTPARDAIDATGWHELVGMVELGILVAFGLAVVIGGYNVGRKVLKKVRKSF